MDVIWYAAPSAAHINLYWSGNSTVLNGWSYSEGLHSKDRLNGLSSIKLHIFSVSLCFQELGYGCT